MTQKELTELIGKKFEAEGYGLIKVVDLIEKSRTKIIGEEIDRGRGWDEKTKSYKGYKVRGSWLRGENGGFGLRHEIHVDKLKKLKDEKIDDCNS